MTNIIFLDIDGVLNNTMNESYFDSYNMNNLKDLITKWPCKIVISSDWRRNPTNMAVARSELLHIGFEIFDVTRFNQKINNRKNEIKGWLSTNKWCNAIILDDMDAKDVDPKMKNVLFYRTNYKFGLTEEDVDKLISYL